jgi:hypothetical protein
MTISGPTITTAARHPCQSLESQTHSRRSARVSRTRRRGCVQDFKLGTQRENLKLQGGPRVDRRTQDPEKWKARKPSRTDAGLKGRQHQPEQRGRKFWNAQVVRSSAIEAAAPPSRTNVVLLAAAALQVLARIARLVDPLTAFDLLHSRGFLEHAPLALI